MVEFLLNECESLVNEPDKQYNTALHSVIAHDVGVNRLKVVELLIRASENTINSRNYIDNTPLHLLMMSKREPEDPKLFAENSEIFNLMLQRELNLSLKNKFAGQTTFLLAVAQGYLGFAWSLFEKENAVLEEVDRFGNNFLHLMVVNCYPEKEARESDTYLLDTRSEPEEDFISSQAESLDDKRLTVEKFLSKQRIQDKIQDKINEKNNLGNTPLHEAVRAENSVMIEFLLFQQNNGNIDFSTTNKRGLCPLELAIDFNLFDIAKLIFVKMDLQCLSKESRNNLDVLCQRKKDYLTMRQESKQVRSSAHSVKSREIIEGAEGTKMIEMIEIKKLLKEKIKMLFEKRVRKKYH